MRKIPSISSLIVGLIIAALGMVFVFHAATARADEINQDTAITFSQPFQIPGRTLSAGTYQFKLADINGDSNIVQIFNADGNVLYATVTTVATERAEPTGNTVVALGEPGHGKPEVLRRWFYPGSIYGHEYVYSTQEEEELAQDRQVTLYAQANPKPTADQEFRWRLLPRVSGL
jgi:hypothetical protein